MENLYINRVKNRVHELVEELYIIGSFSPMFHSNFNFSERLRWLKFCESQVKDDD